MKKLLLAVLIAILSFAGCKKDDESVSIIGKWTVVSGGDGLVDSNLKYIIIEPEKTYYLLNEFNYGIRGYQTNLCQIINNQICFYIDNNFEIFNYIVQGNNLTLSNPSMQIICIKEGDEPSKQDWIQSLENLASVKAPKNSESDLAFDGNFLWYGGFRNYSDPSYLYKINTTEMIVIDSLEVDNYVIGLEWVAGYFWTSSNGSESIFKVNTATGNTVATSVEMGAWIYGIGYDGANLWCGSGNEFTLYKYNPDLNVVSDEFEIGCRPGGISYINGYLYLCASGKLNKCTTDPLQVVAAYDVPGSYINGIASDGNDYWISVSPEDEEGNFNIMKVNL